MYLINENVFISLPNSIIFWITVHDIFLSILTKIRANKYTDNQCDIKMSIIIEKKVHLPFNNTLPEEGHSERTVEQYESHSGLYVIKTSWKTKWSNTASDCFNEEFWEYIKCLIGRVRYFADYTTCFLATARKRR